MTNVADQLKAMPAAVPAGEYVNEQEEAVLRAWLAGHPLQDIAKARRTTGDALFRLLTEVCGYHRATGQMVLQDGVRRPPTRDEPPTPATRQAPAAAPVEKVRRQTPAAPGHQGPPVRGPLPKVPPGPGPGVPAGPQPKPEVLHQWPAHACPVCPYIGPDVDHGDDHYGGADLVPVLVTVTRRQAT